MTDAELAQWRTMFQIAGRRGTSRRPDSAGAAAVRDMVAVGLRALAVLPDQYAMAAGDSG